MLVVRHGFPFEKWLIRIKELFMATKSLKLQVCDDLCVCMHMFSAGDLVRKDREIKIINIYIPVILK